MIFGHNSSIGGFKGKEVPPGASIVSNITANTVNVLLFVKGS